MSDIVSPLLQWLNDNPGLAGLVTFTISAGESVAIIGTIVPGSIMMTALGALAGAGVIPLWSTIFWAILGAIVGDGISYWIGYYFKNRLPRVWPFRKYPNMLTSGEKFFYKYGSMSVFIGRFVGPVRALVPLVAGMLGMRPLQFTIANVASAIGWAPMYMLPGILLGAAALELPPDIALHVMLVLLLITLFILLCLWFIYKFLQLIHNRINYLQNRLWRKMKYSKHFSFIPRMLKYHNSERSRGQLTLAIFFVITGFLFVILAAYVKYYGAANFMVNEAMYHLFRGIRNDTVDSTMLGITLLGQKQIMLPAVFLIFVWLLFRKHWRAAWHALALGVLASGSVFVIKNLIKSPRPWGIAVPPETYSMPSGHTTLAICIYMGLMFLIASTFRPSRRWPFYFVGLLIAFLVSISRLYLGAHWFTDVFSSWLLATAILMVLVISYRRHIEKRISPMRLMLVSLLAIAIPYGAYSYLNFATLQKNYALLNWPIVTVDASTWWNKQTETSSDRTSLFGFPSQHINIEWAGNLDAIRTTLDKEGWSKPPARDVISTMHRIADISSEQYLPLISPQYLDQKPALILTRTVKNKGGLIVIRLWNSNRIIKNTQTPIWVGVVSTVPSSYSWLYKKRADMIEINPDIIFATKATGNRWSFKVISARYHGKKKLTEEKILLVKETGKNLENNPKKK